MRRRDDWGVTMNKVVDFTNGYDHKSATGPPNVRSKRTCASATPERSPSDIWAMDFAHDQLAPAVAFGANQIVITYFPLMEAISKSPVKVVTRAA